MDIQLKRDFFYLLLALPVAGGYTPVGKIFIAYDKEAALDLFGALKGPLGEAPGVRIELVYSPLQGPETILASRCCSLTDACENMKLVFKQTFKSINLE
ncbi:hypothetical protein C7T94_09000 [Pedobacter yulinensis]|uniref:Uncharacterized protein n=1 Tax=Pedobacter yulinensis TaxID=2126353 RepID=A0A2T3HK13_9SPHI|nr:hypothetical protein [Pedobacter yulinensis]PST82774.1 hypothetical protein C7T94_09000 [Pedobacter yulinensis]